MTKIYQAGDCSVVVENDEGRTEYSVPRTGGYVRTSTGRQVCERLHRTGNTLQCDDPTKLLALIRHEHKRGQAWVRKHG